MRCGAPGPTCVALSTRACILDHLVSPGHPPARFVPLRPCMREGWSTERWLVVGRQECWRRGRAEWWSGSGIADSFL
eukprot:1616365-Rhodomonas_salina.1